MTPSRDNLPQPLSPRDLFKGELSGVFSRWQRRPTPEVARDLLAVWAGLQRLQPAEHDPDEDQLNDLMGHEPGKVSETACQKPLLDADRWISRGEELAAATATDEDPEE